MGRKLYHVVVRLLLYGSTTLIGLLLAVLIGVIAWRGIPYISLSLLTGEESIVTGTTGILPSLLNTLFVIIMTLAIALPLGVGAAVYLTEYAKNRTLVALIEFATETLAGIPSILYALVGVIVFCTGMGLQKTLLAGSLTLAIMVLPTVIRTVQESLKAVPTGYREGALGLGAGKWRMIATVVLPCANSGILTGCILSIGRVVGETAVLLYTAGLSTAMQDFSDLTKASGTTLSTALYLYAKERADFNTAFAIAALLLLLTILVNLAAGLVSRRCKR